MSVHLKYKRIILTALLIIACFSAGVFAADSMKRVTGYILQTYKMTQDGQDVKLKRPPILFNGLPYIEASEFGELTGYKITWNATKKEITLKALPKVMNPSDYKVNVKDKMVYQSVVRYQLMVQEKTYPVLTNEYQRVLYFRLADLIPLGLELKGTEAVQEANTKELFIKFDTLKKVIGDSNSLKFQPYQEAPIVLEIQDQAQREALQKYSPPVNGTVLSIRHVPESKQYEYLIEKSSQSYTIYRVSLSGSGSTWTVVNPQEIPFKP